MKWVALALCVAIPARAQDAGVVIPLAVVLDGGACWLSPERCVATGQELARLREANEKMGAALAKKPATPVEVVVAFVVGLLVGGVATGVAVGANHSAK